MPTTPSKTLAQLASELQSIGDELMAQRTYIDGIGLQEMRYKLFALRNQISMQLSGKKLNNFQANMDEVEDLLDGLIRQVQFNNHTSSNFTKDVRQVRNFIHSAATFLTITALLLSIHTPS